MSLRILGKFYDLLGIVGKPERGCLLAVLFVPGTHKLVVTKGHVVKLINHRENEGITFL